MPINIISESPELYHEEIYSSSHVFKHRLQRLENLEYERIFFEAISDMRAVKQIEEIIASYSRYYDVVVVSDQTFTAIYIRKAESNGLPTAKDDFDSPAGVDVVVAHVVSKSTREPDPIEYITKRVQEIINNS
jgi:hypothetical protein